VNVDLLLLLFIPSSSISGPSDVICAKGRAAKQHAANKWFRSMIQANLKEYEECTTKLERSFIVSKIIKRVRSGSPDGGFVRQVDGVWYEIGDRNAREKIGQSFRDLLHYQYRSSTKAKATVRRSNNLNTSDDREGSPSFEQGDSSRLSHSSTANTEAIPAEEVPSFAEAKPAANPKPQKKEPPNQKGSERSSMSCGTHPTAQAPRSADHIQRLRAASEKASASADLLHRVSAYVMGPTAATAAQGLADLSEASSRDYELADFEPLPLNFETPMSSSSVLLPPGQVGSTTGGQAKPSEEAVHQNSQFSAAAQQQQHHSNHFLRQLYNSYCTGGSSTNHPWNTNNLPAVPSSSSMNNTATNFLNASVGDGNNAPLCNPFPLPQTGRLMLGTNWPLNQEESKESND
jgi:hypothetical protein